MKITNNTTLQIYLNLDKTQDKAIYKVIEDLSRINNKTTSEVIKNLIVLGIGQIQLWKPN